MKRFTEGPWRLLVTKARGVLAETRPTIHLLSTKNNETTNLGLAYPPLQSKH